MRLYKCDRCGAHIEMQPKDYFVYNPTKRVFKLNRKAHLCGVCETSFRRWFEACEKRC